MKEYHSEVGFDSTEYFNLKGFTKILTFAKEKKNVRRFDEPLDNACYLRHDVDFSLNNALIISEIESEREIKANFFVLVTSPVYNINSLKSVNILRQISSNGHLIGLHFDPSLYSPEECLENSLKEIAILENVLEQKVTSVSIHNPSVHGNFFEIPEYINAYSTEYFNSGNYLSDSAYEFKTDPIKFIADSDNSSIQILLHPLHYTTDRFIMKNFIEDLKREMSDELDSILKLHRKYPFD